MFMINKIAIKINYYFTYVLNPWFNTSTVEAFNREYVAVTHAKFFSKATFDLSISNHLPVYYLNFI